MEVREAVAARRSVRGYLEREVDPELVRRLVTEAARAPSGGNLQPWHVDIVTGPAMARLKRVMLARLASDVAEMPEYDIYPKALAASYRDRRFAVGEALYAELGIPREDKAARRAWFAHNFAFFGAPVGLFLTVDRSLGPPQWSDLGMYLQTVMLLATDAGLATCAQECWSVYPETVRAFLGTPAEQMLFCGMALGYPDEGYAANRLRAARAAHPEWLTVIT